MKQKEKQSGKNRIPFGIKALLCNFLVASLAIVPFLIAGKGYIAMSHDFAAQEIPFQLFMNRTVKSGNLLWNFNIDLGSNFIESFAFYNLGSPFFWLMCLLPTTWMPKVMGWIMILKVAVAGMSSAMFFRRHLEKDKTAIMVSMLYAFSGFQCCTVVFFHFMDVIALFPFMMIGLEKLVEEKKKGYFAVACLFNLLCNYVFFVGEVMFVVFYYVIIYFVEDFLKAEKRKDTIVTAFSCIWEGMIGCLMSGILLVPAICGLLGNDRVSNHLPIERWFVVDLTKILYTIKAFWLPAENMNHMSAIWGSDWMGNGAYLPLFGMVFVLAYLFTKRDKLAFVLKICCLMACFSFLNNIFTMLSSEDYHRWYYMMILLMGLATGKVLEHPGEYKIKTSLCVNGVILGLFVVFTNGWIPWDGEGGRLVFIEGRYWTGVCIALTGVLLCGLSFWKKSVKGENILFGLTAVFSIYALASTIYWYQNTTDNTNLDQRIYPNAYAENVVNYVTGYAKELEQDIYPYRYSFHEGIPYSYTNMALSASIPSINSFTSMVHPGINEFYSTVGLERGTWTTLGSRELETLLSAKYHLYTPFAQKKGENTEGYTLARELTNRNGQRALLYEDENALPIGFTYDTYILRSELEPFRGANPAGVMLATLVISPEDEAEVSKVLPKLTDLTEFAYREGEEEKMKPVYEKYIAQRKKETSDDFAIGENHFQAVIRTDAEKYAFFSMPYDSNWTVTVNGTTEKLLNICGLMAVKVGEGENQLEFNYSYPPLQYGALLTMGSLLVFLGYLCMMNLLQKRNKNKNQ